MGDFAVDTAIEGGDGRYTATLSEDWNIWGPNGGYLAAIVMRAMGAETSLRRPATFSGHFLSVAKFAPIEITVETLRESKRTAMLIGTLEQEGKPIFTAHMWVVAEGLPGLEHEWPTMPDVPGPEDGLETFRERAARRGERRHIFWENFDGLNMPEDEPETRPANGRVRHWLRFRDRPTFDDPFLDAARYMLYIDTLTWPAVARAYTEDDWPLGYIAPSIDVNVQFHQMAPESEWLLCEEVASVAEGGLTAATGRVWSRDGRLLASGGGQLICVPDRTGS